MFSFGIQDFEILLSFITFFASTALGTLTYVKDRKSWTNRFFGILAFLIDAYIVVNYLSLHPLYNTAESQLFWIRIVMFVCSFIGPTLLLLVLSFPGNLFSLKKKFLVPLLSLMFVSAGASLSSLVFKTIEYPNGSPVPVPGPGIVVFLLDFVGLFLTSFGVLIYKYRKSVGQEKAKILLFLLGVLFTFTFMGLFTVIAVVIFKTSSGVFLGPISFVILSSFVAFAIVKHGLFNIKVITTKILIGILWIVFFSRIFIYESTQQFIIDLVLFLIVFIFGIGLARSVEREVQQKEEATNMAESLEVANLKLQELDKQKTEFLSIASHQLRTPLSILKGYIELIKDGGYGKITKDTVKILGNMDESNEHLIKLVDEFLNISRIEQGRAKYNLADFDLTHMIEGVVTELSKRAEDKGLK
ncbi:MAG: histidine kinase dimerization/phospho-acceptor domain-containing protein, partial [Patescibacteria group bacterium]